jgi:UDPglucose--hexose-1-phosphate uridylyltransferase
LGELRRDYILDRWVVIVPKRGARPNEFVKKAEVAPHSCFFCPNHESLTPPEIGRLGTAKSWKVRWFANKFAAWAPEGNAARRTDNRFYTYASNFGYHEVIVETPTHQQLAELSEKDIQSVLLVYKMRIEALLEKPNVSYVQVFKNSGPDAGTSIVHSHSQIMASSIPNQEILDEVAARRKYVNCPYCDIVQSEKSSERRCFENKDWLAFAPYASRFNYECWIFPKAHITTMKDAKLETLASILKQVLSKIHALQCSYNLVVHYSPRGEDLHFHIELLPRISTWGGFELGTNIIINTVAPEDAAKYYRGEQ